MGSGCEANQRKKKLTSGSLRTLSSTAFMSVIATSVFCTRSSSAFSTSKRACSCLEGPAVFNLKGRRMSRKYKAGGGKRECGGGCIKCVDNLRLLGSVQLEA